MRAITAPDVRPNVTVSPCAGRGLAVTVTVEVKGTVRGTPPIEMNVDLQVPNAASAREGKLA